MCIECTMMVTDRLWKKLLVWVGVLLSNFCSVSSSEWVILISAGISVIGVASTTDECLFNQRWLLQSVCIADSVSFILLSYFTCRSAILCRRCLVILAIHFLKLHLITRWSTAPSSSNQLATSNYVHHQSGKWTFFYCKDTKNPDLKLTNVSLTQQLPFCGPIGASLTPGAMIRISGTVSPYATT